MVKQEINMKKADKVQIIFHVAFLFVYKHTLIEFEYISHGNLN